MNKIINFKECSVNRVRQKENNVISALKHIEYIGRVCYNSQDKITEDSYIKFVKKLCIHFHTSVLEHGRLLFQKNKLTKKLENILLNNKFIDIFFINDLAYLNVNFRVLYENNLFDVENGLDKDLENALAENMDIDKVNYTFEVNTSIAITREFNRHRVNLGISELSTRYVNLGKEGIVNILKGKTYNKMLSMGEDILQEYYQGMEELIQKYNKYIKIYNMKTEDARAILPLDVMSKVYYTSTVSRWGDVLRLRSDKSAHKDAQDVANLIIKELSKDYHI